MTLQNLTQIPFSREVKIEETNPRRVPAEHTTLQNLTLFPVLQANEKAKNEPDFALPVNGSRSHRATAGRFFRRYER
jgi:hypothetical protein